jgi:hypothetical protein
MRSESLGIQRVMAVAIAALAFQIGCSSDSDNQAIDQLIGGSFGGIMTASAGSGGAGGVQTAVVGGSTATTTTSVAGKSGSAGSTSSAGKAGTAGASGNTSATAGKATAGASGAAGKAGGGGSTAGSGGDPCGADSKEVTGTTPKGSGSGFIEIDASGDNEVLSVTTTMIVPSNPQPQQGTLFLWPGLQPAKEDNVIGYGVLQPVLTWGSSCAPGTLSTADGWWISGQYVGSPPGQMYTNIKCEGGKVMKVKTGDKLDIEFVLNGTVWSQKVTNQSNGTSVDFDKDLKGQNETRILFDIELPSGGFGPKPVDDVIFTSTVIKYSKSAPDDCVPITQGATDYFSPPRVSSDGKTCCLSKIIVRAQGVAASSPNTP